MSMPRRLQGAINEAKSRMAAAGQAVPETAVSGTPSWCLMST